MTLPRDRMTTPAGSTRRLWLVRHGETEWARDLRHTSRTDVPLTDVGERQAHDLGRALAGRPFDLILTSPLVRARTTATLAGMGAAAIVDRDLTEWDYGDLEGLLTQEIRAAYPGWSIWEGPWPGGETAAEVAVRADRVIERSLTTEGDGDVLLVAHGHLLRVLAARWLGLAPAAGSLFAIGTATISILGWDKDNPAIELWNAPGPPDRP